MSAGPTREMILAAEQRFRELAISQEGLLLLAAGAERTAPAKVQLAREGSWATYPAGPFKLDVPTFEKTIANFKKYGTRPVFDIEHTSVLPWDSTPAQGHVEGLDIESDPDPARAGKAILSASASWSDVGRDNITNDRYRYLSIGLWFKDKDRETGAGIGPRLDHVALTKKPFIEGMQSLSMFSLFSHLFPGRGRADEKKELAMNELFKKLALLLKASADVDEPALLAHVQQLEPLLIAAVERRPLAFVSEAAVKALKLSASSSSEEVSAKLVELAAGRDSLVERVAAIEAEKITASVDKAIEDKRIYPAERVELITLGQKDPALFLKLLAQRQPIGELLASVKTDPNKPRLGDIMKRQQQAIDELMAKNKDMSYRNALLACAKADPELFRSTAVDETGREVR